MGRSRISANRKVDYLEFEEFQDLLRELGFPEAKWWERVRAEISMRTILRPWHRRLTAHVEAGDLASPVRDMHCAPLDNPKSQSKTPASTDGQPLIRYPYKPINLMSEGLTFTQLACRDSLVYSSTFSLVLRDETINPPPLLRAAKLLRSSVRLWREIALGHHLGGLGNDGLEAAGFHDLFSTNRIPVSSKCDVLERRPYSSHVVVALEGLFFPLTVIEDGEVVSVAELFEQLRHLEIDVRSYVSDNEEPPVGVLTSLPRQDWHAQREELIEHPLTKESLEAVESALFVVCLDLGLSSDNRDVIWRHLRDREVENRWFDKSFQLVVMDNATAAMVFESSAVDTHVASQFANRVCSMYEQEEDPVATAVVSLVESEHRHWEPLPWVISKDSLWDSTALAASSHAARSSKWEHATLKTRTLAGDFFEQEGASADIIMHLGILMSLHAQRDSHGANLFRVTHTRHVEGGRQSLLPLETPAVAEFVSSALAGKADRILLEAAVESVEGRLIRLESGWDARGMLMALVCFADEGDLIDRANALELFQNGLTANPIMQSFWYPRCITHGIADYRAIDFLVPATLHAQHSIQVGYTIRRGFGRIDVWASRTNDGSLHQFCGILEKSLRHILRVMGGT